MFKWWYCRDNPRSMKFSLEWLEGPKVWDYVKVLMLSDICVCAPEECGANECGCGRMDMDGHGWHGCGWMWMEFEFLLSPFRRNTTILWQVKSRPLSSEVTHHVASWPAKTTRAFPRSSCKKSISPSKKSVIISILSEARLVLGCCGHIFRINLAQFHSTESVASVHDTWKRRSFVWFFDNQVPTIQLKVTNLAKTFWSTRNLAPTTKDFRVFPNVSS